MLQKTKVNNPSCLLLNMLLFSRPYQPKSGGIGADLAGGEGRCWTNICTYLWIIGSCGMPHVSTINTS